MFPTLGSKAKRSLLLLSIASCFSGISYAEDEIGFGPVGETTSIPQYLVFTELNTDDYDVFLNQLNNGVPVYTTDPSWKLSVILSQYKEDIDPSATLNFAFFQLEGDANAFNFMNFAVHTGQALEDPKLEVGQALNIWMVATTDGTFNTDSKTSPVNSALELLFANDTSLQQTITFSNQVNLTYTAYGNGSRAISVGTIADPYPVVATFEKNLNVEGQFYGEENALLFIGGGTTTYLLGETNLTGIGGNPVTGVYFVPTTTGYFGRLEVQNNFIVSADYALEGPGIVNVDYTKSDQVHWVALHGSLDNFTGTWTQHGGYLYLSDKVTNPTQWTLSNVWLVTGSENVLNIPFNEWVSGTDKEIEKVFQNQTIKGLILTDPVLSLEYLQAVAHVYGDSQLLYYGEISIPDDKFSAVSLDGFKLLSETDNNLVLAKLVIDLGENQTLEGETIHVGAIRGDEKSDLTLTNSQLALYRIGAEVAEKVPQINVGENSTLSIYGGLVSEKESQANVATPVNIGTSGTMNLYGRVDIKSDITNNGTLNFQSDSEVNFLATLIQESGKTEIKEGAYLEFFSGGIQLNGGELGVEGKIQMPTFQQTSGLSSFNGEAAIPAFELGSMARGNTPIATVGSGAILRIETLNINSGHLVLGDGNRETGRAFLTTNDLSIKGSGALTITGNGVLIYGKNPATFKVVTDSDDENSDSASASDTNETYLTPENVLTQLSNFGVDQNAVLAMNVQMDLSRVSGLIVGETAKAKVARATSSISSSVTLGEGSVLLIDKKLKDPVFTSSEGTNTIALEDGSSILVLDAFNLGNLTDGTVEIQDDYIGSNIVSTSSYVDIVAEKTDDGWIFVNSLDMEKATSSFIYPTIQTYLYTEYDDFSTTSNNVGVEFLAKADNKYFMSQAIKDKIIAQTTQVSRMLGAKLTAYESVRKSIEYMTRELDSSKGMKEGDHAIYGGINYDFLISRYMNSYLGGTGFRSNSQNLDLGLIYALNGTARVGVSFGASTVDSKPRHSSLQVANRQWNFMVNAGIEKDLKPFRFGAEAGYLYTKNRIKGSVPGSMEMARLTSDLPTHMFNVGVNAAWHPIEKVAVGLKPTWRIFASATESIKFGGQTAFKSKSHTQSFVDLPLYVGFKGNVGRIGNAEIDLSSNIDGALRFGQRKDKVDLSIPGVPATERLKLDYFGKWNAGIEFAATARTKRTKSSLTIGARTGGDATVGATAMLDTRWTF